ncbi:MULTISPECIES: DUF5677 domain-containing protein [Streptomyces]|uniref:Uncharacterized protein n=1 Tax=Streptomyces venezuelae TaxID=54571 RepID=A0A5P2AKL0_STRVZ|nr:DUF5677 domain-containing protein [Streptomyces venezuelae]QES18645.1 hypothetical protein DEJ46_05735 [Streptomyces venezuelae]
MEFEAAHLAIQELVRAFEEVAGSSAEVREEYRALFWAAYGWWAKITRTSQAISMMTKAGLGVEADPLARVVIEHTLTLHWLVDEAPESMAALEEEGAESRDKLRTEAIEAEWKVPAGIEEPELPPKGDEHPLRADIVTFKGLTQLYGEKDDYVAYRILSGHVHASELGSKAYLEAGDDGSVSLRSSAGGDALAPLTHAAYCLIQAARLVEAMLISDRLSRAVSRAPILLGHNPPRPQLTRRPPKEEKPLPRLTLTAGELADAERLAEVACAALRDAGATLSTPMKSQKRRRVMVDVTAMPRPPETHS